MTDLENIPLASTIRLVLATADALEDAQARVCEVDSSAGDGDYELPIAAARGIRRTLADQPPTSLGALLDLVADAFVGTRGSMGALVYVLVQALRTTAPAIGTHMSPNDVARLLDVAQTAVCELGGAHPGDKTIVDATAAASEAAADAVRPHQSTLGTLIAPAEGARAGADATSGLIAPIGRASRIGELSRAGVDPGAMSFPISMQAFATAYAMEVQEG
jgi:hypothetical protein